jgi:hypothetical protein
MTCSLTRSSLPSTKISLRGLARFPAGLAQGICLKPLRQLQKTAFGSPDHGTIRKHSLQISLPAGKAACAI